MKTIKQAPLILITIFLLFILLSPPIQAEDGKIELVFKNQTLSAKIKGVSLRSVIAKIKEKKGIWFKLWLKGQESLVDEKLSVQFKDQSVQNGLRRILSGLNHSLIFNRQGELLGVILLGKPDRRFTRRSGAPRRSSLKYRRR